MQPEEHGQNITQATARIREKAGAGFAPKIAIILGSGLGGLGDKLEGGVKISYRDLPGFPVPTVSGHAGELIAGQLGGRDVIALKGRQHFYETSDAYPLKTMIRTMRALGAEVLFLSNAAGSVNEKIGVGQLMLITDHINLMGFNPLVGENDAAFGPRFFSTTNAWDAELGEKLKAAAKEKNITLHAGVYAAFRGPSFETPAEIRMVQKIGGDAVGMSSVPECLIARHCGMKVVGVSCITNMGAGLSDEVLSHDHTLENAKRAAQDFEGLVAGFAAGF